MTAPTQPAGPDTVAIECQAPGCGKRWEAPRGRLEVPPGWHVRWVRPVSETGTQGTGQVVVLCPEHRPKEGRAGT